MDIPTISAALSSIKALYDLSKTALGVRDQVEFEAKRAEFLGKINEALAFASAAKEENSELQDRLKALTAELASLKDLKAEMSKYELQPINRLHNPNLLAYKLKPQYQSQEAFHLLCANCFKKNELSVLQMTVAGPYLDKYACGRCGQELPLSKGTPPQSVSRGGSAWSA
jgi:rRNA maturation endonuclease Nob1